MELYKDEDYRVAKRGTILRFVGLAAILAATIAVMALFLTVWRNEILSMAACAVGASVLYFFLSMKALPWLRYWLYLSDIRKGREHEMDCRFVSMSEETRLSDGVAFHDFVVKLEDTDEEDNERLLLWDDDKKAPPLKPDQRLHIRSFGNYIIALETE